MKGASQRFDHGNFEQFFEKLRVALLEKFFDLRVVEELADVALGGAEVQGVLAELVLENAKVPLKGFHFLFHAGDFGGCDARQFF